MAQFVSNQIAFKSPCVTGDDKGGVVVDRNTVSVPTIHVANDLVIFGKLPTGHELVDAIVISDQIDSGAGLVTTVGVVNDAGTDLVTGTTVIASSSTLGRSAGTINRADTAAGLSMAALTGVNTTTDVGTVESAATATSLLGRRNGDRAIGLKITTAAATKVLGNITLVLSYRAI